MEKKNRIRYLFVFVAAVLCVNQPIFADYVNAIFELRLAAGEADSKIGVGETLDLEVWLTLDGMEDTYDVQAISLFLDVNDASNNIISFNGDFVNDTALPMTDTNGTDNTPITGEFSRSSLTFGFPTEEFEDNAAEKIGHFSVTGLALGTADYTFSDDGQYRVWGVGIDGYGEPDQYSPASGTTAMTIIVTPEPGALLLFVIFSALVIRERRRNL